MRFDPGEHEATDRKIKVEGETTIVQIREFPSTRR
jgi:hypothetical protein